MLENLQVRGTVNYVKNYHHLEALELLSIFGRKIILLQNVVYVVAKLGLLENLLMDSGCMPSVLR